MCLCGPRLQVRSVRRTGSTSLLEYWRMPYRLGHETVCRYCSWASQYTTHTHTSAEESSQYSEYTIHCSPTAGAHSPRSCGYAILYCTLLPLPILLYRPDIPFLLPTPMSPLTRPYCHPCPLPKYLHCLSITLYIF